MTTHPTDAASGQTEQATLESSTGSDSDSPHPLRVLIVDDGAAMPGVVRQLSAGIENGSYVVERATTLADGFGAIVGGNHDVCIVDHHIGARTGFDLLARINAEGLHVPIVFVTDSGDHGTGVTAVGAGASSYIVKDSVGYEHLDQCLRQAVEQERTLSRLISAGVAVDGGTPTKTQILSHIAERLAEPAAAILGAARATLGSDLPARAAKSLAAIEDEVTTLLTLAHDLSDLSLLESGRLHFDSAPFSLSGVVESVKRITNSASGSRDIEIVDEISAHVPDSVVGDPSRLRLVLLRIVDNVIARSSSNRIVLKIDERDRGHDTVTLHFTVAAEDRGLDTTQGFTVDDGTTSTIVGSPASHERGVLGIPVALEMISRMGGHINVENDEGRPDRIDFTVRLGIGDDEGPARRAMTARTSLDRPILIIADALNDRRSIVKTLSEAGLSYVVASSSNEWSESTQANGAETGAPIAAVIASTADSFAECDRFNALATTIPVIVIASTGQRGDAARCRERGVKGYLANPLDPGDLVDAIRSTAALAEAGDTSNLVTRHWLREGRRSLHVLVVDDSPTSLFLMTRMLDQRGHSTATACDGNEAVEEFQRDTFDVVLMDVLMPGIDGFAATRLIRSLADGTAEQPLIVGVSAFTDESSTDRSIEAGMDAMLTKPIRPDDLFALVEGQTTAETTRSA